MFKLLSRSQNVSLPPLENPKIEINNKLTRYARNAAIGLFAIGVIGTIATFTTHGSFLTIGSDIAVAGGIGTVISGIAYAGLRLFRDRGQSNDAKKTWPSSDLKGELEKGINNSEASDSQKWNNEKIGKKTWNVEVFLDGNTPTRVTIKNT